MKPVVFLAILFFSYNGYAQKRSVQYADRIITPKKIIIKHDNDRPNSLIIPIVSEKYPGLKRALSDTGLFEGNKRDSVVNRYQAEGKGITSFNYEITFISQNVISLKLYYETMNAHPDIFHKYLTLNVHTGKTYPIANEINQNGLRWIYESYRIVLRRRIVAIEAASDTKTYMKETVDSLKMNDLFGNYCFTKAGVLFTMGEILPYGQRSFEPKTDWIVPYYKLRKYKAAKSVVLKEHTK